MRQQKGKIRLGRVNTWCPKSQDGNDDQDHDNNDDDDDVDDDDVL